VIAGLAGAGLGGGESASAQTAGTGAWGASRGMWSTSGFFSETDPHLIGLLSVDGWAEMGHFCGTGILGAGDKMGRNIRIDDRIEAYVRRVGVREHAVLAGLRAKTEALGRSAVMQIAPEQGAFMAQMVRATGARRCLEIGVFTGYSSTAVALALPPDGHMLACDVSEEWTAMARQAWADAGVAHKVTLKLAPAVETLDALLENGEAGSYDMAFIDADKTNYDAYVERALRLVRRGGTILIDNVLWSGSVAGDEDQSPDTVALRALNEKLSRDPRVDVALLPIGDGITFLTVR